MDLARDEETRVRNLGRLALEKAAKAGASKAGSNGISRTFATVSRVNGDGTIDVSMGDYTDVNGVTSECILRGLRMTVACSSAQVGDRVIVDTYAHVSVVTGILANADNTHYVRHKKLWEGSLSNGGSVTIPELAKYAVFGAGYGVQGLMYVMFGAGPSLFGGSYLTTSTQADTGSSSYALKATFRYNFTTGALTLTAASHHLLSVSGAIGYVGTVNTIYGIC